MINEFFTNMATDLSSEPLLAAAMVIAIAMVVTFMLKE